MIWSNRVRIDEAGRKTEASMPFPVAAEAGRPYSMNTELSMIEARPVGASGRPFWMIRVIFQSDGGRQRRDKQLASGRR